MSQTFSGTLHLSSSSVPATAVPLTLVMWTNNAGGQGRRLFQLNGGSNSETNCFGILLDVTSASNKLCAYRSSSGGANQALTSAITTSTWQHYGAVFASTSSAASYLNGTVKGTSGTTVSPAAMAALLVSGRPSDFAFGIGGQAAHMAAWARALSDAEMAYLGGGGNPRAIKGVVSYWKLATVGGVAETPVADQIGSNDLTPSATIGAGTSDPSIETFMTGTTIPTQNYTVGVAISSINLGTSGTLPLFDEVTAAYTATLKQLGSATAATTTSSAGTAVREIAVVSVASITVNGYIKVTSGGTPTRVLATNATANTILVAADQTYSSGAQIYTLPVNSLTVSGLSISSNVFSGTPVANATNALCFFRATNNTVSTAVADTNLFTMNITGGGGGTGGMMLPAGIFSGGFVGG